MTHCVQGIVIYKKVDVFFPVIYMSNDLGLYGCFALAFDLSPSNGKSPDIIENIRVHLPGHKKLF